MKSATILVEYDSASEAGRTERPGPMPGTRIVTYESASEAVCADPKWFLHRLRRLRRLHRRDRIVGRALWRSVREWMTARRPRARSVRTSPQAANAPPAGEEGEPAGEDDPVAALPDRVERPAIDEAELLVGLARISVAAMQARSLAEQAQRLGLDALDGLGDLADRVAKLEDRAVFDDAWTETAP